MSDNRKIEILESIAAIAQDSAEHGKMDPSVYADVFELIVYSLHSLIEKAGCAG